MSDDPDATVLRPPARGAAAGMAPGPVAAPGLAAAASADTAAEADPDATVVRPAGRAAAPAGAPGFDVDPDATVIRNTRVQPPGGADAAADAADTDRTVQRGTTLRDLPKRSLALQPGLQLHEYRIEKVLGQGGFGITYLATDANLSAQVAIKEYLPEEIAFRASDRSVSPNASQHRDRYQQGLENFLTEARTLASFRHPNIVRVARFFEAHRTAYMVLEYERGRSFKAWWIKQNKAAPQDERLLVERLQPLLDGLSVVHAAGYLHRDIKPDNIQVRAEDGRFVLLDFGSASQTVALADQDAVVVTPGYAPVEQYGLGEQGAWTDIYALGATLYWAVAGHKPPDAEARASGISLPPAVEVGKGRFGRAFLEAIDWALQMDPADRPRTIEAWRDKLLADHVSSIGLKEALRREDAHLAADDGAGTGWRARAAQRLRSGWRLLVAPSAWPLAAKLVVAMLVTALLPMMVGGLYNYHGAQAVIEDMQLRKAELTAHNSAGRVAQLLQARARLALAVAVDPDLARWLQAPQDTAGQALLQQHLQALAQADPDIEFLAVLDAQGQARISTAPALVGRSLAARGYFQAAAAGQSHVTGVGMDDAADAAGVFFAEPVRDAQRQVLGVVVLRLHTRALAAVLDEVRHDTDLTPFLLDADGVVVHHPERTRLFMSLMPLATDTQARMKDDQRFRRDRVDSLGEADLAQALGDRSRPGHVAYRSVASGADEIAGFAPVPGQAWTVVVSQSRAVFEKPLQRLMATLHLSVPLAVLLLSLLALRFARSIVRPVQALTAGAHALKSGQFDQAYVSVKGRDELGQLARTFNVMVDVLRQRERERETRRR